MLNPLTLPKDELLLRGALAFSFLYPAIHALFDPYAWIGYFPGFLISFAGSHGELMLHAWGVVEVVLALLVLFGRRIFVPSVLMALALAAVIAFNPSQFPILFRDVSIALIAVVLALKHAPHGNA